MCHFLTRLEESELCCLEPSQERFPPVTSDPVMLVMLVMTIGVISGIFFIFKTTEIRA